MLGYLTTIHQVDEGYWIVRLVAFANVIGHGCSVDDARTHALTALVWWIEFLIENQWPIPTPVATTDEHALIIHSIVVERIAIHNETYGRPPGGHRHPAPRE